jgi:hypothetical protein
MPRIVLLTCFFFLFISGLSAQTEASRRHGLGLTIGPVYLSDDDMLAPAVQLEYDYSFLMGGREWFAGAASEVIFMNQRHIGLAVFLGYSPFGGLGLNLGPGVMFEGDKHYFSANLGMAYEFDLNRLSIGPALELAHTGRHYHLLLGLVLGISF